MVDQMSVESNSLLIELGVEELPAGSALPMAEYFASELHRLLTENEFFPGEIEVFSTPRRLAARVHHVRAEQAARDIERRGPAIKAAYDESGNPSKALIGFARSLSLIHI